MSNLKYQLQGLALRHKSKSPSTQSNRIKMLVMIASQLKEGNYKLPSPDSLKPKHVSYLVERWQSESISPGTIKNRMSAIRWWAECVGKSSMLPKSNHGANQAIQLNIDKRVYVSNESKAKNLDIEKLEKITDPHVILSLKLQKEFGLRREESMKFRLGYADKGDKIVLKGSWCKGGRPREISIRTESQKALLDEIRNKVGIGSLIRHDRSYKQQLRSYQYQTDKVGLDRNHGLRHMYAQQRYLDLTGRLAPHAGGLSSKELTPEQKQEDREVRMQITEELGHSREQITAIYLGR